MNVRFTASTGLIGLLALTITGAAVAQRHGHAHAVHASGGGHAAQGPKTVTLKDGLKYQDLKAGKGPMPKPGQTVVVNYVGTLPNGQKFDASADHGGTFSFVLGEHHVIPAWEEGLSTMRVGGKRKLIAPPQLAYGPNGFPPVIPPNATLIFVIDLLKVQ